VTLSEKFVTPAGFRFAPVSAFTRHDSIYFHGCIKNQHDLQSLRGKGAAVAAVVTET